MALQHCVPGRCGNTEVFVQKSVLLTQAEAELTVEKLLSGLLLLNPSPECSGAVEPFLCIYYFGLCDSSGELYLPSSGECETLTTETCASEFQTAISLLGRESLPQCDLLSHTLFEMDCCKYFS